MTDSTDITTPTDVNFRYQYALNSWSTIAPLHQPRMYIGICVLERSLFVLGGSDAYGRYDVLTTIELNLNIMKNIHNISEQLETIAKMSFPAPFKNEHHDTDILLILYIILGH